MNEITANKSTSRSGAALGVVIAMLLAVSGCSGVHWAAATDDKITDEAITLYESTSKFIHSEPKISADDRRTFYINTFAKLDALKLRAEASATPRDRSIVNIIDNLIGQYQNMRSLPAGALANPDVAKEQLASLSQSYQALIRRQTAGTAATSSASSSSGGSH